MKVKIKIKLDIIKHFKEKESELAKKMLESVKFYKVKAKTTPSNGEMLKQKEFKVLTK